ncbi:MAG: hypothetical protein VYE22_29740 [Myxococcota bacterium]|nr:hypothetical protein [Myxococcota bacterium]
MGEALSEEEIRRVIEAVAGTEAVLVAGQAISVWATYYADRIPELQQVGVYVSRDVDFYGDREAARTCARRLDGDVRVATASDAFDGAPINSAVVSFQGESGHERRVDFLANVHGVLRGSQIRERAVPLDFGSGTFLIIDPISQLQTRLANLTSLRRGQPAARFQASIAVWVAREWLVDVLSEHGARPALRAIERLFRLARLRQASLASVLYGVEVFDAIQPLAGLPEEFGATRYPQMSRWVARRRARLRDSQGDRLVGPSSSGQARDRSRG